MTCYIFNLATIFVNVNDFRFHGLLITDVQSQGFHKEGRMLNSMFSKILENSISAAERSRFRIS